jgi:hypothetical protein
MPSVSVELSTVEETGVVTTASQFINGATQIAALVQLSGGYSQTIDLQGTAVNTSAGRIVVFDRILLHPEHGLMLVYDFNGSGDNYLFRSISIAGRVIATGDHLEYDVFIDPSTPAVSGYANGGLHIGFSDASFATLETDQNGYNVYAPATGMDALARGKWYSRKISFAAHVGKTTNTHRLSCHNDAVSGTAKTLFRNIRWTDGAGTTRQVLWNGGEPTWNNTALSNLVANVRCGPANSFIAYLKDTSNTLVAGDARYSHKGV